MFLIDNNYCKKQKTGIIMVVVKKKLLNIILTIKNYLKKSAKYKCRNFSEKGKEAKREQEHDRR